MFQLRDYQINLKNDIYDAWRTCRNVLAVSPTGSGKTAVKGSIFKDMNHPSVAIAHRQELVSQISNALAQFEISHRIIAPKAVVKFCIQQHIKKFGKHFHHPNADIAVAGVDTLVRRHDELAQWCSRVKLWDIDEAHHVLPTNKWGKAVTMFPNAMGLGLTATPIRCDRKSLGRETGGAFDALVEGPNMRDLIDRGYLADYKIFGPPSGINWDALQVSNSTGDFTQPSLVKEMDRPQIIGDIVDHYLRIAPGKLGITFVVSVDIAGHVADAFRQKGVPAEAVSAKTPDHVRQQIIERFARGEIKQMVNVDLFGEGMDVPAVEVVSAGRPTLSYGLFVQQFGRALRPAPGKTHGVYIDHVGNVIRHGLPDKQQMWLLNDYDKGRKAKTDDAEAVTTCTECFQARLRRIKQCPFCGHIEVPEDRSLPENVDGDLIEFSPELLARLRGDIEKNGQWFNEQPQDAAQAAMAKNMIHRANAQVELRNCIAYWAGIQRDVHGREDSESYRLFYLKYGVDVLSAQAMPTPKMQQLTEELRREWT